MPHHQRALGVAVGQRVTRETLVVQRDGLDPVISSLELEPWTKDYRLGLATGLLEDADARTTITPRALEMTFDVLRPVEDWTEWLEELRAGLDSPPRQHLPTDWGELVKLKELVTEHVGQRSGEESALLNRIAEKLKSLMFFAAHAPDDTADVD